MIEMERPQQAYIYVGGDALPLADLSQSALGVLDAGMTFAYHRADYLGIAPANWREIHRQQEDAIKAWRNYRERHPQNEAWPGGCMQSGCTTGAPAQHIAISHTWLTEHAQPRLFGMHWAAVCDRCVNLYTHDLDVTAHL